jgi:hypothetical protein
MMLAGASKSSVGRISLAIAASASATLYAAAEIVPQPTPRHLTTNNGSRWTQLTATTLLAGASAGMTEHCGRSDQCQYRYFGGIGLFGPATVEPVSSPSSIIPLTNTRPSSCLNPTTIFAGNDGGLSSYRQRRKLDIAEH